MAQIKQDTNNGSSDEIARQRIQAAYDVAQVRKRPKGIKVKRYNAKAA